MDFIIFDLEADGLLEEQKDQVVATRIWCFSYYMVTEGREASGTITSYDQIGQFLWCYDDTHILIGHNISRYDIPMLEKFIGYDLSKVFYIDTLALSWYLYPMRMEHGLESWGDDLAIPKPVIEDWQNGSIEEYKVRCETDVKINTALWHKMFKLLSTIYDGRGNWNSLLRYLKFKMDCAREQEEQKWRLDIEKCKANLAKLVSAEYDKIEALADLMPKRII